MLARITLALGALLAACADHAPPPTVQPGADPTHASMVTGRIVDGLGVPIPGCTCEVESWADGSVTGSTTDAAGRFVIPLGPGRHSLLIAPPGQPPELAQDNLRAGPGPVLDLGDQMLRARPGLVVRALAGGQPLPSARVRLVPQLLPHGMPARSRAATERTAAVGKDGMGVIPRPPQEPSLLTVSAAGFRALHRTLRLGELPPGEVAVALEPAYSMQGALLHADGSPFRGRDLLAEGPEDAPHRATIDAQGAFRLYGLGPGPFRLRCEDAHGSWTIEPVSPGSWRELRLPTTRPLRGTVHLPDRRPAAGARVDATVTLTGGDAAAPMVLRRTASALVDSLGQFEITDLPSGRSTILVSSQGRPELRVDHMTLPTESLNLTLASGASVQGQLEGLEGRDTIATLELLPVRAPDALQPWQEVVGIARTAAPDRTFTLAGVTPGHYVLRAAAAGTFAISEPFEVVEAGTSFHPLRLQPGAHVAGRVLRLEAGVAQVPLQLRGQTAGLPCLRAESDAAGRFHFAAVPAGTYTLVYGTAAGATKRLQLALTAGAVRELTLVAP